MALAALIVAVAAATVSLLGFLWTVGWSIYTHRRATRPVIAVKGSLSFLVYGPHANKPLVSVTASNVGFLPTTLRRAQFEIRSQSGTLVPMHWVTQEPAELPIKLDPGDDWAGFADVASLEETLADEFGEGVRAIRPVVGDSSREYRPASRRSWIKIGSFSRPKGSSRLRSN